MRLSLRLREREARRSRYLDMPLVSPQSARYANEFIYILTNHLFTH